MSEYIEREKTIKPICEACNKQFPEEPCEPSDCTIMQILRAIPAADVRPVVRGKWIQRKNWTRCVCSACSWEITFVTGNSYNYCPNCGADMRSELPEEEMK